MDYGITYGGEPHVSKDYSNASWSTNEEDTLQLVVGCLFIGGVPFYGP